MDSKLNTAHIVQLFVCADRDALTESASRRRIIGENLSKKKSVLPEGPQNRAESSPKAFP